MRFLTLAFLTCGLVLSPLYARSTGSVDFFLTGLRPDAASVNLEFNTCDNSRINISLDQSSNWHRTGGPSVIDWSDGNSCQLSAVIDYERNGVRYFGNASCLASADS